MSLNVNESLANKSNGPKVEQPALKPGGKPARVVRIVDLGLQPQKSFDGKKEKRPMNMVQLTYELSHEFMVDEEGKPREDKPRWIDEDFPLYNLVADRAKSTARYQAIDPDKAADGDFSKIGGFPCTVVVVNNPGKGKHLGRTFSNVGDVTPAPNVPGYVQPELKNPVLVFEMDNPNLEVFNQLSPRTQETIKSALNFKGSKLEKLLGGSSDTSPATEAPVPAESDEAVDLTFDSELPF